MTIEEMKFMRDHVILSRTEYNRLNEEIIRLMNKLDKVIEFAKAKHDASGLVYQREILDVLGIKEAEPFE